MFLRPLAVSGRNLTDPALGCSAQAHQASPHTRHTQFGHICRRSSWQKVTFRLPSKVLSLHEYLEVGGKNPFRDWFDALDPAAAAKVAVALTRIERGNLSNTKGVGEGVQEYRIDFGPGYRIYFGRDGDVLVILLGGGTKRRQQRDIVDARCRWADYKQRKRRS